MEVWRGASEGARVRGGCASACGAWDGPVTCPAMDATAAGTTHVSADKHTYTHVRCCIAYTVLVVVLPCAL